MAGESNVISPRWDERLAYFVSDLLCPPITALISIGLMIGAVTHPLVWAWGILVVLLVVGVPVVYVAWKVRTGDISDFHIPIRSQRIRPMLLSLACLCAALAVMWIGGAPAQLISIIISGILLTVSIFMITLRWKISTHTTAITCLAFLLIYFGGPVWLFSLLLIPLVGWARVRICRHTTLQAFAGVWLGVVYISLTLLNAQL